MSKPYRSVFLRGLEQRSQLFEKLNRMLSRIEGHLLKKSHTVLWSTSCMEVEGKVPKYSTASGNSRGTCRNWAEKRSVTYRKGNVSGPSLVEALPIS